MSNVFIENEIVAWTKVAPGIERSILAYDDSLMLVKVKFDKEAIGVLHQHPHVQISYIESGLFEVEIGGEKKVMKSGDTFYAPSNVWHGVVCLEKGVLLDSFSPMRKDFI
ncbi:MAG: cupin domain-containing protein [Chitinophagia bacterium]|jgi:quercetin dioxygenase-like cupin family protein